jgi:hypothetical protein
LVYLPYGRFDILSAGICHGLDNHRSLTAYRNVSHHNGPGFFPFFDDSHGQLQSKPLKIDGFVKSSKTVMPDLIPAKNGIFDRHPESIEITGFLPDPIRDPPE